MADSKLELVINLAARVTVLRQELSAAESELSVLVEGDAQRTTAAPAAPAQADDRADRSPAEKKTYPRMAAHEVLRFLKDHNRPMDNEHLAVELLGDDSSEAKHLISAHIYSLKRQGLVKKPPPEWGSKRDWVHNDWQPPHAGTPDGDGGGT